MVFSPLYFGDAFDIGEFVPVISPTTTAMPAGIPLTMRPLPRQIPFTERFILYGIIRHSFTEDFRLVGSIVKPFMDNAMFSATAIKTINESCLLAGYIITDDIPTSAWERLFEELEE